MAKFNYILNDLALINLVTRNLYSKNVCREDKEELENQIKLIMQENKQLKDNWNRLKEQINNSGRSFKDRCYDLVCDIDEVPKEQLTDFVTYLAYEVMKELIEKIEIEQGSDSNE